MRKYKDLNNTAYPRVPSANTVKLSTGAKNNLKYNAPGMPIGGIAIIYDKYHQIFDNGTYKSKAVGTYVVGEDGILRLTNLRDSVYSIQFQNIEHVLYNISELHVGNPDLYNSIFENEIPYPVIITGLVNGYDLQNQAFLTIYWKFDVHQIKGNYEIWIKASTEANYQKHTTIYDPLATQFNILPLDYGILYYIKMKTINAEGLSRGYSNIVSGTTLSNPFSSGVLDTESPTGHTFYY